MKVKNDEFSEIFKKFEFETSSVEKNTISGLVKTLQLEISELNKNIIAITNEFNTSYVSNDNNKNLKLIYEKIEDLSNNLLDNRGVEDTLILTQNLYANLNNEYKIIENEFLNLQKKYIDEKNENKNLIKAFIKLQEKYVVLNAENKTVIEYLLKIQTQYLNISKEKEEIKNNAFEYLNLFHKIQKDKILLLQKNKNLENELNFSKDRINKTYYGVENRVKAELPYMIGEVLVKDLNGKNILLMPYKVLKTIFTYNHKVQSYLIPLEDYSDYHNSQKVKNHLSYRVGKIITSGEKLFSKKKVLEISKEILDFKFNRIK